MAYEPGKTRNWNRQTLNDGDLFDDEFDRIYTNLNDLNARYDQLQADYDELKKSARIIGEKFWLDEYQAPSVNFPAFCISQSDTIITSVNWPDLVSHLYAKPLRYTHGGLDVTSFRVTGWAVATVGADQVATLTFPDSMVVSTTTVEGSPEYQLADASGIEVGMFLEGGGGADIKFSYTVIAVDQVNNRVTLDRPYHQVQTNYDLTYNFIEDRILPALEEDIAATGVSGEQSMRTITLPSNFGNIPAGDYMIQSVDANARTISFLSPAAATGSGTQAGTVEFYPHRIAGSSSTLQHFTVQGRAFVTPQDEFGEVYAGLRRRDRFQGHLLNSPGSYSYWHTSAYGAGLGATSGDNIWFDSHYISAATEIVVDNHSNGEPRIGHTTDPRLEGNYAYIWGKTYTP